MSHYDAVILADSPLSFWKCDESSGTTLADSGTGGNPLTLPTSGAVLSQAGIGDGESSVGFTGSQSPGGAEAVPAQTLSGSFTVEHWVNVLTFVLTSGVFSTRTPSDGSIDIQSSGAATAIHADIGTGTSWLDTSADMTGLDLVVGQWYYVVYTVTSTGFVAYLDGAVRGGSSWASATPLCWDSTHHISLCGDSSNQLPHCLVAKVAVYDYALTGAQILTHFNSVTAPLPLSVHTWPQAMWRSAYR